jgi:glucosamine-6-phosphate deaminase
MRRRLFRDADAAGRALARDIARALAENPLLVLGLPAGQTPIPFYRALVRLHARGRADFSRAAAFNLDEFRGIAPADPHSYHAFMRRALFDAINLRRSRIHFLDGLAPDAAEECARYERAIARAGGIDVQIVGLGLNGHIGFNEPARALVARTHLVRLQPPTRRTNASIFGGRLARVPREGLTMGMGTILRARRIVLVATGAHKAAAVDRLLNGRVRTDFPASFLQLHPNVEVWLDRAAAASSRP